MRRVTGFTLVLLKVRRPGRGRGDSHESGTKKSAKDGKERKKAQTENQETKRPGRRLYILTEAVQTEK